jgi:hypothetical protein
MSHKRPFIEHQESNATWADRGQKPTLRLLDCEVTPQFRQHHLDSHHLITLEMNYEKDS